MFSFTASDVRSIPVDVTTGIVRFNHVMKVMMFYQFLGFGARIISFVISSDSGTVLFILNMHF